jgi:hypothetical protein
MAHFCRLWSCYFARTEGASANVRVLLAGMSKLLANIVAATLAVAPDIVLVGAEGEDDEIPAAVRTTRADAVVTQSIEPQNGEAFRQLLLGFPALKVIAIGGDGSRGFLHELHLVSTRLEELSSNSLQAALRGEPPQTQ